MLKNYNKLTILSVILLVCAVLVLAAGFPLFDKMFNNFHPDYDNFIKSMKYMNILFYSLLVSYFLSLLASVTVGIIGFVKIRKTKERGGIIAILSVVISALLLFSNLYAGWGLW